MANFSEEYKRKWIRKEMADHIRFMQFWYKAGGDLLFDLDRLQIAQSQMVLIKKAIKM